MERSMSRSRSRSMQVDRAPAAGGASGKRARGEELMEISSKEAALIVGKGGSTKKKVENAADVRLELDKSLTNDEMVSVRVITRDENKKNRAREYISLLLHNKSETKVNLASTLGNLHSRDDLTVLIVPQQTVGYITGKNRSTLHSLEEDSKTLMFFESKDPSRTEENLLIFSVHGRGRKQAELKIMSAIESKVPGYFLQGDFKAKFESHDPMHPFGLTVELMDETQFTYALGKGGNTRRKLERASGALIEYVGYHAFIAGTPGERRRGLEYLRMLLLQKDGKEVGEVLQKGDRDDLTIVPVPKDLVATISGPRGSGLRRIEDETDTFCFFETRKEGGDRAFQKLYVLGESRREREIAEDLFTREIRRQESQRRKGRDDRDRDRNRGRRDEDRDRRRGRSRSRSHSGYNDRTSRRRQRSYSVSSIDDDRSSISMDDRRRRSRSRSPAGRRAGGSGGNSGRRRTGGKGGDRREPRKDRENRRDTR